MKINRNLFYFIVLIPLAFIVGVRGDTPDSAVYYRLFKTVDFYDLTSYTGYYEQTGVELGWGLFSKIVSLFTQSDVILFSLFSLIIFFIIYKTSRLLNINYLHVMAFYLPTGYFFMQQFMQIRQALAVSLVVYASLLLLSNKKITSLILFATAILFHQISFAFSIVALLYYFLIKKIDISASLFKFRLLNLLILILGFIFIRVFLKGYMVNSFDRLESYSETVEYGGEVGFLSLSNLKGYLLFLFFLFFTDKGLLHNKLYVFLIYMFTVGLTLRLGFYDFAIVSGRLSNVFLYTEVFILPIILMARLSRGLYYASMLLYFIFIAYITWFFQASEHLSSSYLRVLS